ncbi:hypothetical protein NSTCB13_04124 [Nostoc sp. DSM 114160]|jgi:hypothetical protein
MANLIAIAIASETPTQGHLDELNAYLHFIYERKWNSMSFSDTGMSHGKN